MTFDQGTWWIAVTLLGTLTALVSYLWKRQADDQNRKIERTREDVLDIQKTYTPRTLHDKEFGQVREEIKEIRSNYLTKEDFLREQSKTDRKLDSIINLLMQRKDGV